MIRYWLIKYELSELDGDGERVRLAVDADFSLALKISKTCICCTTNVIVNGTVEFRVNCSRTASTSILAITSGDIPKPPQPIAGNAEIYIEDF